MSAFETAESPEHRRLVVAARLVARYDWRLLTAGELAQRMAEQPHPQQLDLSGCAIAAYCGALYRAASGAEGATRRELAYAELARFLAGVIRQRYPALPADLWDDVLQSALERLYRKFERCREPAALLAFAGYCLLDAVREAQRHQRAPVASLSQQSGADDGEEGDIEDGGLPPPDARLLAAERRSALEGFLRQFLHDHPQAAQQVEVQRLGLLEELDSAAIARRLKIAVGSVYTARSRFTDTVRREPKWRKLAAELGLLPDEL